MRCCVFYILFVVAVISYYSDNMPVRGAAEFEGDQLPVMNPVDLFSVRPGVIFAEALLLSLLCEFLWCDLSVRRGRDPADIDICSGGGGGLLLVTCYLTSPFTDLENWDWIRIIMESLQNILDDSVHWRMFAVICAQFGTLL